MARIRSLKPEFNKSASVARMSDAAQLFMLKIIPEMDDYGRIEWLPKLIAGVLYPYRDDIGPYEIESLADELAKEGIFERYEVGGKKYARFPKWTEHQKVDKPGRETIPGPTIQSPEPSEDSSRECRESVASVSPLERDIGNGNRERELDTGEGVSATAIAVANDRPDGPYQSAERVLLIVNQQLGVDPPKPAEALVRRYVKPSTAIQKLLAQYKDPAKVAGLYLHFHKTRKFGVTWENLASEHASVYADLLKSRENRPPGDRAQEKLARLTGGAAA